LKVIISNIPERWLGVDFSGNYRMWLPNIKSSNVWIADVRKEKKGIILSNLCSVQDLEGHGCSFERLVKLLGKREFKAAGIDASFSVPIEYLPDKDHSKLLQLVVDEKSDRPFISGKRFIEKIEEHSTRVPAGSRPLRKTEIYWQHNRKVSTRSSLWKGARSGAPMTAACLTLIQESKCPIWPWCDDNQTGMLLEAFPAAQLCHWQLPYKGYNADKLKNSEKNAKALSKRQQIIEVIEEFVSLGRYKSMMLESADALDAVICCFAAMAVTSSDLVNSPKDNERAEGWIAVKNSK